MSSSRFPIRTLVLLSLLLAAEIILSRFLSISLWNLKIGFAFLPVVIAARKTGPLGGAAVAGLGDLMGALLFPIGPYYPGFTFTALLVGLCYGFLLHRRCTLPRILLSVGFAQLVGGLLLNTLWISLLYGSPFWPLLGSRLLQIGLLLVVEPLVLWVLLLGKGKRLFEPW